MMNSKWYLITIEDPAFLPGISISNIIQLFLKNIEFKFVILNDLNGAGISSLLEIENEIIKIEDLLKIINQVIQFDWGDFFLFKEYPQNWKNLRKIPYYPNLVIQTDTTIRAVDDQYIYVYTPYDVIVNLQLKKIMK